MRIVINGNTKTLFAENALFLYDGTNYSKEVFCEKNADTSLWQEVEWNGVIPGPEPIDENAEVSDYENALSDLGVRFGD